MPGIPVAYRAGDQPNNAFSLNVLNPGEIAATAGTSGVVYGVSDEIKYDPKSRVNTFAHVNHAKDNPRLGVLLCINGTGILNSWLRRVSSFSDGSYDAMNEAAATVPPGSDGLSILPFGNGAERMLENRDLGAALNNINFNRHSAAHLIRAAQEGIAFAFRYGMDIMHGIGIAPSVIRAGKANMFLSPIFRNTLSGITGARIELYNTDGSIGAARRGHGRRRLPIVRRSLPWAQQTRNDRARRGNGPGSSGCLPSLERRACRSDATQPFRAVIDCTLSTGESITVVLLVLRVRLSPPGITSRGA